MGAKTVKIKIGTNRVNEKNGSFLCMSKVTTSCENGRLFRTTEVTVSTL